MSDLRPCAFCGAPGRQTAVLAGHHGVMGYVNCSKECGLVCMSAKEWNEKCEYADKLAKKLRNAEASLAGRDKRIQELEASVERMKKHVTCDSCKHLMEPVFEGSRCEQCKYQDRWEPTE